ncbi:hypothetical protein [Metabacillus fastidiosus]|uniref:hypothetical protein n=1 Tax=Metabacillus fastidiosus TaxID=1458 RepID=UPI003D2956B3
MTNIFDQIDNEKSKELFEMMAHPLFTPFPTSIEDSYHFGWARGIALLADSVYFGNWYKWLSILGKGEWQEGEPFPYTEINTTGNEEVRKMLKKSFEPLQYHGVRACEFIEWIGFALGLSWFKKPNIDEKQWEHLYKTVNFELFYKYPSDYLSYFLAENGSSGHLDYYPTPLHVTIMMNKMLEIDSDAEMLTRTVFEPCLGTGAMTLPSKSLNVVGADLNHLMVRAAAIQAFFYKPSMLYVPKPVIGVHFDRKELRINKYFEFETDTRIYQGDSLLGEYTAPKSIFLEDSEFVDVYFHALDLEKHEIYQYEEDLEHPWESLSKEKRFEIVKAMAREIRPDNVLTNPPFNMKISQHEREKINEIERRNKEFLALRENKQRLSMFHTIEKEVEKEIEIAKSTSKSKNIDDGQLMLVF